MLKNVLVVITLASLCTAQQVRPAERPVRQAVRGEHGAVAGGSEYATEAGMRLRFTIPL